MASWQGVFRAIQIARGEHGSSCGFTKYARTLLDAIKLTPPQHLLSPLIYSPSMLARNS